jgi:tetratricopeptide (TPR) repeat protein
VAGSAVHRTIIMLDVEGFGDPKRTLPHQIGTRAGLYQVAAEALEAAGVPWDGCYNEDRGDSVFVLVPPEIPKSPLVEVMPQAVAQALHAYNRSSPAERRVRLRMAIHAGEVAFDDNGVTSTSLTTAFRLLDATPVKTALATSPGALVLIVSQWIFDEVVRHCAVLDPTTFRSVPVRVKETVTTGWIALPDHPYPADPAVLNRPVCATSGIQPPRQLPAMPNSFAGRVVELAELDRALRAPTPQVSLDAGTRPMPATGSGSAPATGVPAVISAIRGAGGIGKTWLALTWAHRRIDRFPDGQLFVDLRGFSPDSDPMPSAVAVRGFLDALGVDPARIPSTLDAQAALYRSLVADRRMLIVLDNAADTDQVSPLLPGGNCCTVLVTSRRTLNTLIGRHGANPVRVDPLGTEEAHALLSERIGAKRATAEPQAVRELVGFCRGFALALGIVATRAHTNPQIPLDTLATELRELGLGALDDDDPTASLPAVLSWSYRALPAEHQQVFALLGIAPGPDIARPAVASLTGLPAARAGRILRALEEASLLNRDAHDRYAMHDLIRSYAQDTAHLLADKVRAAALRRVIDFYIHAAHSADLLLAPYRAPIRLDPPAPGTQLRQVPDVPGAMAWFDVEHLNLLAAQHLAATLKHHHAVWQLAWALTTFHNRRGHRHDELAAWQAGLAATEHLPSSDTPALVHRVLGSAYAELGHHDDAARHLHQALILAEQQHDLSEQANTHHDLAWASEQHGNDQLALRHAIRALHLYRTLGQPVWEAEELNAVGWYAARLGDHDEARAHCQAALILHRRHHNPTGEAETLDSLGYIDYHTGHHYRAIDHYHRSLALFRELGNTFKIPNALDNLGRPYMAVGQYGHAHAVWQEALELYRQQGRGDDIDRVRQRLDHLKAKTAP